MLCLFGKPPVEFLAATVTLRRWRLLLALDLAPRAVEANVEMIVVAPPRPDSRQPAPIVARVAAQRALDRRIDKDAGDRRALGRGFEQFAMLRPPNRRIDIIAVAGNDVG